MTDVATQADILKFRKAPMTNAQRQKAWRERQKAKKALDKTLPKTPTFVQPAPALFKSAGKSCALEEARKISLDSRVMPVTRVTLDPASWVLRLTSIALAGVGLSMNAVYAHSLGSSDLSGWLFLALGVAADSAALVLPSVAASARDRIQRVAGWAAFVAVFAFAITASVGFASVSISDVTMARNGRVTPAVTAAQAALADAKAARDRECKGGVGKFCRQREDAVTAAQSTLEAAYSTLAQSADPQTAALVRIVAWTSHGLLTPSEGDVGMIRLILFALLPQIGGILLMVSRR